MLRSAMCACFSLGTTVFYMLLTCTYQGRSVWLFWYIDHAQTTVRSTGCSWHFQPYAAGKGCLQAFRRRRGRYLLGVPEQNEHPRVPVAPTTPRAVEVDHRPVLTSPCTRGGSWLTVRYPCARPSGGRDFKGP